MSTDIFTLSWFIVFALIMLIAFIANLIIILAILRDKSMHTSTYFYIINVNVADILLVLSCLPERLTAAFGSNDGFRLGMFTCYLLPFLQQVSMHAALAFLLVLTIHRCYPAGVPRFLQGDLIRRQIRNHSQTSCILWAFAILINLPLFSITKYDKTPVTITIIYENGSNLTYTSTESSCFTGAGELWSRTYLILLLVLTYLITGIFLIVIYGQVIRIILASNRYAQDPITKSSSANIAYQSVVSNKVKEPNRTNLIVRIKGRTGAESPRTHSTSSSASPSNRIPQQNSPNKPMTLCQTMEQNDLNRPSTTNHHSAQHMQVIVMVFIVIILYILLLLPYRLLNLLYIVHNQLFQRTFMNEILFQCLINTVRLLVFLNCALQPLICLRISSRLRQTVLKLLRLWYKCYCYCRFSVPSNQSKPNHRNTRTNLTHNYRNASPYQSRPKSPLYRDNAPLQTSINNINLVGGHALALNHPAQRLNSSLPHANKKNRYVVSFSSAARH